MADGAEATAATRGLAARTTLTFLSQEAVLFTGIEGDAVRYGYFRIR